MNYYIRNTRISLGIMLTVAIVAFIGITMPGCATSQPIKTTLDLTTDPSPALAYSSEKDVLYSRTTTDPITGIIDSVIFKALASPAAYAQVERDTIQAQANASNAAALSESVSALGAIAAQVITPSVAPAPLAP